MATDHAQPHSAHSHAAHPDDGGAGDVAAREKTKSADRGDRGFGKELASTGALTRGLSDACSLYSRSAIAPTHPARGLPDPALPLPPHTPEKKIRDKAVTKLAAWLEARGELVADDELARLWKGLFYCFWMSDKRPVQHQLAETLASIALRLRSPTSAIKYIGQFWRTLVAEWSGVDRLRIDKFYLLCRRFHRAAFRVLGKDGWSGEAVDAMCAVLGEGPLDPTSPRVPDSLRYHTAEVFFDEL
ncbi:Nop52-domain-containing protein, partial [Gonapodya prolifera JEL478]